MPATASYTFGAGWLQPYYRDDEALTQDVALVPGTYARGTVLGQVSSANVNDVQTLTITGSPTSSIITLSNLPDGSSMTFASNVTPAAMATALNARLGAGSVGVTGTLNASYVITAGAAYAHQPLPTYGVSATFVGGTTPAIANVHTTTGVAHNYYAPYASGNSDGSQNPAGLLKYPCVVDNSGKITISSEIPGFFDLVAPMFISGWFHTSELVGLDANAVTKLGGHLASGTVTSGIFGF